MPKTQKQSGYLVVTQHFIAADLGDTDLLSNVQKAKKVAASAFDMVGGEVTIIKSTIETARR